MGNMLFLDAPGGTGKSYLLNLILAKIRSEGNIVLATASSGIAATVLQGGRTLHTMFKIPLDTRLIDQPTCGIKRNSVMARLIETASAIIIDEAPMSDKSVFEALDRTLQDIKRNSMPMGGIPVLFSGDFRQILPVVPRSSRADIVKACLKRSYLWEHMKTMHLHVNMRAQLTGDPESLDRAQLLLDIGDGKFAISEYPDTINVSPDLGTRVSDIAQLKDAVYGNLRDNYSNSV